ncbi:MAG: hypothetical protein WCT03_03055 [Candidatus Obscuribacterales bacterium]
MNTFLGITQGALTSAISKAFSAVTSQLQASEMIRADVHESEVGSQKTPDSH